MSIEVTIEMETALRILLSEVYKRNYREGVVDLTVALTNIVDNQHQIMKLLLESRGYPTQKINDMINNNIVREEKQSEEHPVLKEFVRYYIDLNR